jgi:hypothetical protein
VVLEVCVGSGAEGHIRLGSLGRPGPRVGP